MAGALLSLATVSVAQQTTIPRVEITGSHVKRIDTEGPQPVTTITREDIERSGQSTVGDLLRNLPIVSGGTFFEATGGGSVPASGTAAISLRGLGTQTTLVLVNGRRVANYGFAQGKDHFVDLNSIAVEAIERIEVLKDGASAIYGSDAIAGVVNVILRKDYRGLETRMEWRDTKDGGAAERRLSATLGIGDLAKDKFNLMLTVDWYKRDPLFGKDRPFSATANHAPEGGFDTRSPTGSPGTWLTAQTPIPAANRLSDNSVFPSCPAGTTGLFNGLATCFYDFAKDVIIMSTTERTSAFGTATWNLTEDLAAFLELGVNQNESMQQRAATPGTFNLPPGHNSHPAVVDPVRFAALMPYSVRIRYRYLDVGHRQNYVDSLTRRAVLGLRGTHWKWDWELALNHGQNEVSDRGVNYINALAQGGLVAGGTYNFVNPSLNSMALTESLRISPVARSESNLDMVDFKAMRELIMLPGGPMGIAVGLEYRKEAVNYVPDPLAIAGLVVASVADTVAGSRTVTSAFAELSLPIFRSLEGQVAVRHDDYSDFGRADTPKLAFKFKPASNFLIRGGMADGFRAPSLAELFLGSSLHNLPASDVPRCDAYTAAFGAADPRTVAACAAFLVNAQVRGNPNLLPEESRGYYLGAVWEPIRNLTLSADWYAVRHNQLISYPLPPTDVVIFQPGNVVRDSQTPNDVLAGAPGPIAGQLPGDTRVGITGNYFNALRQETHGLDFEARYRWSVRSLGQFTLVSSHTYMAELARQLIPNAALLQLDGTYQYPRYRSVMSLNWNRGPWEGTLAANHIGRYKQEQQLRHEFVKGMTTWDLQLTYKGFKNTRISLGGRNILNTKPPFSDCVGCSYGYDDSTHDPRGAIWYARLVYKFD